MASTMVDWLIGPESVTSNIAAGFGDEQRVPACTRNLCITLIAALMLSDFHTILGPKTMKRPPLCKASGQDLV